MKTRRLLSAVLTLILLLGSFSVWQRARADGGVNMQNVTISADGYLSWSPFAGASKYHYSIGGHGRSTTETTADLIEICSSADFSSGTYPVKLYAQDANGTQISATWTGSYVYTEGPKLATPTNVKWNKNTVSWDAVEGATNYLIRMTCGSAQPVTTALSCSIDLTGILLPGTNTYQFELIARGRGYRFSDPYTQTVTLRKALATISTVSIYLMSPIVGEYPSYEPWVPKDCHCYSADYTNGSFKNDVIWFDETDGRHLTPEGNPDPDVFERGHVYRVTVWLTPEEYYDFSDDVKGVLNNSYEMTSMNRSDLNQAWFEYVFPALKEYCTVSFDPDGGSAVASQTVEYGKTASKPADPKKNGYAFKGWYLGSTPYDFSTPVTADVTLKAKWEKAIAYQGTVTIDPNDVQFNGKTPYRVYDDKAQKPGVIVKDKSGKTVAASKYTVTYRDNTNPGTAYADVTMKDTGATASAWFKIYLPPTKSTTVENVQNGIKISWKKVDNAKGYVIYRRAWNLIDKGWTTFERWNNTTKTTWTDTKVYAGTRYQYGIKAYFSDPMDNYNLGIVGPLKTTVRITTRTLNSVTPGSRKLTVKWSGSSVFTGYEVQVATDAAFTKDVKTVTVKKATTYQTVVKGLKAKTTYYVRVRSYHVFEGMTYYGGWSNVLTGKTK